MKTVLKTMNLPVDLIEEVKKFAERNYITTFTASLVELVRRGLEKEKEKNNDWFIHAITISRCLWNILF